MAREERQADREIQPLLLLGFAPLYVAFLLAVTGFVALWLAMSLLVNKAPDYTRLLVILPFVVYLVIEGAAILSRSVHPRVPRWGLRPGPLLVGGLFRLVIGVIVCWNVAIEVLAGG